MMDPQPVDLRRITGLVEVSGLSLTDDEIVALAMMHARFERQRAVLSAVSLGETEPMLTFSLAAE